MLPLGTANQSPKGFEYRASYWIHKNLSYCAVDSKRNTITILLTRIWQILSILNNGILHFTVLGFLLIGSVVNDFWSIPIIGYLFSLFSINKKTMIIFITFFAIDVILLGLIKYYAKRKRPTYFEDSVMAKGGFFKLIFNKYLDNVGVDQYTFPSGHCSKIVLVTMITYCCTQGSLLFTIPLALLILPMGIGRIALAKHFLFDCLVGYVIGIIESGVFFLLWWLFMEWWYLPAN